MDAAQLDAAQLDAAQLDAASGCGSVGTAVASMTIGLQFESSHRQNFKQNLYLQRRRMSHFKKVGQIYTSHLRDMSV